ncbi:MAG TPA: GWxTD domain-containing protein [Thermoanaerobaculia bacterium]|nr:GWxTD domain-containing protein [Thermoanaerobaculia bacterium]
MRAYGRAATFGLCLLLGTGIGGAASLPELLQKAKEEFRNGSFADVLRTLSEIEAESGKPGLERDRAMLEPIVAFYRGASYASLGKKEEARANFAVFLKHQPNASLDAGLYSRKVIAALEEARRTLPREASADASVEAAYRAFARPAEALAAELPGPDWAEGPVRYVLTPAERQDYGRISDTSARSAFVVDFWQRRDPTPETPENEARSEFEKRVAFADSRFTQQETRGSLTDRGMVFVLLGPPTYVGRKPLTTADDASGARALSIRTVNEAGGRRGSVPRRDSAPPGRTATDAAYNWREVWHYRKEKLPAQIPYLQVDFDFVTKRGYGENVLQRDPEVLDTLERAKAGRR